MAKGLVVSPDKCTGCRTCELACSYSKSDLFNPKDSAISVMFYEDVGLQVPMMCMQCDVPHCVTVCMVDALTKDEKTGVVNYDKEKCIGCKLCEKVCPSESIEVKTTEIKAEISKAYCFQCANCQQVCPADCIHYSG